MGGFWNQAPPTKKFEEKLLHFYIIIARLSCLLSLEDSTVHRFLFKTLQYILFFFLPFLKNWQYSKNIGRELRCDGIVRILSFTQTPTLFIAGLYVIFVLPHKHQIHWGTLPDYSKLQDNENSMTNKSEKIPVWEYTKQNENKTTNYHKTVKTAVLFHISYHTIWILL